MNKIFPLNWDGSSASFSKEVVTSALIGVKYGQRLINLNKRGSHLIF